MNNKKPDYAYWAKLPEWNASQFAFLLLDQEPPDSDYNEEKGFGRSNWGAQYNKNIKAIMLWFENDLKILDVREYTSASPSKLIELADYHKMAVPTALKKSVKKYASKKSIHLSPEPTYTTPYLELMKQAIIKHGITAENQPKKDFLYEKFREEKIDGKQISKNIADAMATLIRLPESQGGAARPRKNG